MSMHTHKYTLIIIILKYFYNALLLLSLNELYNYDIYILSPPNNTK